MYIYVHCKSSPAAVLVMTCNVIEKEPQSVTFCRVDDWSQLLLSFCRDGLSLSGSSLVVFELGQADKVHQFRDKAAQSTPSLLNPILLLEISPRQGNQSTVQARQSEHIRPTWLYSTHYRECIPAGHVSPVYVVLLDSSKLIGFYSAAAKPQRCQVTPYVVKVLLVLVGTDSFFSFFPTYYGP